MAFLLNFAPNKIRHFINSADLPTQLHHQLIRDAIALKQELDQKGTSPQILKNKIFTLFFEKPSTRTRVAFETGIKQMGGDCLFVNARDSQSARMEPPAHTARVLSAMTQGIILRVSDHARLVAMAAHSSAPVINALSPEAHPCQLLADMMTFYEKRGSLAGKKVVWCGDGNNVCRSYIQVAKIFDLQLHLCGPQRYLPPASLLAEHASHVHVNDDPTDALRNADLVCTDVWVSMADKDAENKKAAFAAYQLTPKLLDLAKDEALFMHCLPAKEGEEISVGLLDDPRSVVWTQAENRLHSQKALLATLFA